MHTAYHAGLFYEGDADLWCQLAALLRQLATGGGRWLYVADEHSPAAVALALVEQAVDLRGGTISAASDMHLRDPVVSPDAIAAALKQACEQLHAPLATVTVFVEMSWAISTSSSSMYVREYEAAIEGLTSSGGPSVVCLYNQSILLDRQLLNGLQVHGAICGHDGTLQPNPYFVPPALFVQRNERAQFHYWLGQVRASSAPPPAAPPLPSGQLQPIYHIESPAPLVAASSDQRRWQIASLGPLRVQRMHGEPLSWAVPGGATYKTKTLFAYLLFCGEEGAPASELADLLWPEATSSQQSLNRLYHTVRSLRQALSPALPAGRESPFVVRGGERYYLALPPDTWVDLPVFQEQCYRANLHQQNQQYAQALQCYQAAKRLYRGDLLADLPAKYIDHPENDWCWSRRYWFRNMYLKVLHEMALISRQLGDISQALALCDEGLRSEPCSELLHQQKMQALHAAGRRDALHRQYRLYCRALAQFDMGEPTEATTRLYHTLARDL
jgi:DNA-binding SARP family transcriptional activator